MAVNEAWKNSRQGVFFVCSLWSVASSRKSTETIFFPFWIFGLEVSKHVIRTTLLISAHTDQRRQDYAPFGISDCHIARQSKALEQSDAS